VPSSTVDLVTLAEARYLSLIAQRLEWTEARRKSGPSQDDLLSTIRSSGCLQLDSISVVSRAHETAVWSRVGCYNTNDLAALHYPRGELIEYWAHAASLLPVEFFHYLRPAMARFSDTSHKVGRWGAENQSLIDDVLRTIERDGPLSTRAFSRPEDIKRMAWDWWGGKPAKQALDLLWTMGELVVIRRTGFERVYDLTDRAMPGARSVPLPSPEEQARFFTQRALSALGVGTLSWIADYYRCGSGRYVPVAAMKIALEELTRECAAVPVAIEGQTAAAWLDPALIPALNSFRSRATGPVRRTLISPFDNLIWRRDRALALFGFDYRLECYTPEPKRIFGYYSLPILIRGLLVGRLDARYRRKERLLSVHALHLEPGTRISRVLAKSIAGILREFTTFLGGGQIEVLKASPEALLPNLLKEIR
jgi:uncharacterized protein YcaQ